MRKYVSLLIILLLNGCFLSTPNSQFYLLQSGINCAEISNKKISIAISDISIPEYLDRPQIVLQKPNSPELKIAEFDRWASDLNIMLQNTLIENLQCALPKASVLPLTYGYYPQYTIYLQIKKLNGWPNNQAYLKFNWKITNPNNQILAQNTETKTYQMGKTYSSYVEAISILWKQVASEIAQKLVMLN